MSRLRVERFDGLQQLRLLAGVVDAVNVSSASWSPFHTSAFLIQYAIHSEFFPEGLIPYVYIAFSGDDPIGTLVTRRQHVSFAPRLGYTRIDFLATHDNDHCGVVAKAGCEVEVTMAILAHLTREKGWALVEFRGQELQSLLRPLARDIRSARVRVREVPLVPFEKVSLHWNDMGAYFSSLSKRMRSNVSRQTRHLYAAGNVQLAFASGGQAVGALFESFCDLENRSWKAGTEASMQRHPKRKAFYAEVAAGNAGLDPSFVGVVLDGVLIAGLINGSGGGHTWSLEMAFDQRYADLGPGQLLLLLTVGEAIHSGSKSLRFFQHHDYFKKRWLSEPTEAVNVQLIRTCSLMGLQALGGDAIRAVRRRRSPDGLRAETRSEEPGLEVAGAAIESSTVDSGTGTSTISRTSESLGVISFAEVVCAAGSGLRVVDAIHAAHLLPFSIHAKG